MHKHYIINGVVEFHPATSTLREISAPDHVVVLNSPAGRCLLLLIERAGTIVTQQEFMEIVWQRRGMLVSSNTYYQNISILRKGLKKIGFDIDPIVTIPRIGLTLASDTDIVIREAPPHLSPQQPEVEQSTPPEAVNAPSPLEATAEEPAADFTQRQTTPPFSLRSFWLVTILFSVLTLSGVGIISHSNTREDLFVDSYRFAASSGSCRIYLANDIQTQAEREKALAYVAQFADDCVNYPWVYVAWYAMLPRASVVRCERPMKEPNRCISDYFIEDH